MDSNIGDIIRNSLDSIRELADVNTIIGEPINASGGTTIIPISKVSLGFASGGIDFAKDKPQTKSDEKDEGQKDKAKKASKTFSGGGGTGLSITPIGFLVISANGAVTMLDIKGGDTGKNRNIIDSLTNLLQKSPDIVSRLKDSLNVGGSDKKSNAGDDILGDDAKFGFTEKGKSETTSGSNE